MTDREEVNSGILNLGDVVSTPEEFGEKLRGGE